MVITEIMYNPPAATGFAGQWVEVRSLVSSERTLTGCVLTSALDTWNITVPATVPAMGNLVIARDSGLGAVVTLTPAPIANALFPTLSMSAPAFITIECDAAVVSSVAYAAFWGDPLTGPRSVEPGAAEEGKSLVLSSGATTAADVLVPNNWGRGSPQYATGLRGTPGTANPAFCVPDTCVSLGYNCDTVPDGCGGTVSCGTCTLPGCNTTTHRCL